eukprot:1986886-Rhodomonas_salina.3
MRRPFCSCKTPILSWRASTEVYLAMVRGVANEVEEDADTRRCHPQCQCQASHSLCISSRESSPLMASAPSTEIAPSYFSDTCGPLPSILILTSLQHRAGGAARLSETRMQNHSKDTTLAFALACNTLART